MIPVNLPEEGELRLLDSAEPTSWLARAHNRITCAARMASESLLTLLKRVNRIFTSRCWKPLKTKLFWLDCRW